MDDIAQFIDSRPLVGIDHNHLNSILHAIVRNQQQLHQANQQLQWRLQQVDQTLQDVVDQQRGVEQAVQQLAANDDEARNLRANVKDLSTVVDSLARQAVPELRRGMDEMRRNALPPLERALQTVQQNVAQIAQAQEERGRDADHGLRQMQGQVAALQSALDEQDRDRAADLNRVADAVRDLQGRLERQERSAGGPGSQQWREAIEELTNHANNNFHQVELSAKAVDAELNRIRTDLANCRTDLNTLDNNTRQKFSKVTDDMDSKFEMILGLLQNYERSSSELEEHLAAAGRALASSKAGGPSSMGRTTTTTTALRPGGNLMSDVRSEPMSGRRGVSGGW